MLIAHLSDLHLRDESDAVWLDRQLDRIAARKPDHLAITGDLIDRWEPPLLERVLDSLRSRDLLDLQRLTVLHGNHDLASSGGHPQRVADLWRLVGRSWNPPPLAARRRREFHRVVARRAAGIAAPAPWRKTLASGATIAVIDTVPAFWLPVSLSGGTLSVRNAIGRIPAVQASWLAAERPATGPFIVLMHHYPLHVAPFRWTPDRIAPPAMDGLRWLRAVDIRVEIAPADRARFWQAAGTAGVRLVLCGHVHRARLDHHDGIMVGLNGQSGADWAGRTIAWYEVGEETLTMATEAVGQ